MKRIITPLLFTLLAINSAMAVDFTVDKLMYTTTSDTEVTLTGHVDAENATDSLIIPTTVSNAGKTYSVTSIGDYAFGESSIIGSLIIPNSVKSIGIGSFVGCDVTSLTIGNSVTSIGDHAFGGSLITGSLIIPNSVKSIGIGSFVECELTSLTIGNSVTSIGDFGFGFCIKLKSVTIGSSVEAIGEAIFAWCVSLTSLSVATENKHYKTMENILYNKAGDTLIYCASGTTGEVIIPNSVTSIAEAAFAICLNLTSVIIPNSVTNISEGAFALCDGLEFVTVAWETPLRAVSVDAFSEVSLDFVTLKVPQGSLEAYKTAEVWKDFSPIEEYVVSNIHTPTKDRYNLYVQNGTITIENLENVSLSVRIYNVTGVLQHAEIVQGKATISVPQNGVYVVRVGNKTSKVVVW